MVWQPWERDTSREKGNENTSFVFWSQKRERGRDVTCQSCRELDVTTLIFYFSLLSFGRPPSSVRIGSNIEATETEKQEENIYII